MSSITVQGFDGSTRAIPVSRFVLALGALETARFLLNVQRQTGASLGGDMVGRTFMEHFFLSLGKVLKLDEEFWERYRAMPKEADNLVIADAVVKANQTARMMTNFEAGGRKRYGGRLGFLRSNRAALACNMNAFRPAIERHDPWLTCEGETVTGSMGEHLPNRDSRVTLGDAVDRFGQPRLNLAYELSEDDWRSLELNAIEVGKALAETGVARFQVAQRILDRTADLGAHCHHMGTTRMAANVEHGVVDPDCRVFGTENLYVAGSSVFSSGGTINPTFTIVALALRLGDHLAQQIAA